MFRVVSPPIIRSSCDYPQCIVNVTGRPVQSRSRQFAVTVLLMPDAVDTVTCAPVDGWRYYSKHVERFTDINKLYIVASCWTIIAYKKYRLNYYFTENTMVVQYKTQSVNTLLVNR